MKRVDCNINVYSVQFKIYNNICKVQPTIFVKKQEDKCVSDCYKNTSIKRNPVQKKSMALFCILPTSAKLY